MSTYCAVSVNLAGSQVTATVKYDGYPERMLPLLNKYHNSGARAAILVLNGEIRQLHEDSDEVEAYPEAENQGYTATKGGEVLVPFPVDYVYLYEAREGWRMLSQEEYGIE